MISIIITSFNEPRTIGKAIDSILQQNIKEKYELIIAAPDKETHNIVNKYRKKHKHVKLFKDPGKGKSYAINLLLPKLKGKIIILTDGDVYASENSINHLLTFFEDKRVGCVSGQPVSQNQRNNLFGYWSYLLCHAAHILRLKRHFKNQFLECSGYLWAFKNKVIKKFPTAVAEDTIVPIMFYLKNYKIKYSPNAKVFVKFPTNLHDFIKQKRRAAASHGTIFRYINPKKIPQMKTFMNELLGGFELFFHQNNLKELFYIFTLFPLRLYIWANLFFNQKLRSKYYTDSWKIARSTK